MASLATADICDTHITLLNSGDLRVLQPIFQSYGLCRAFSGPVVTLKVFEDNVLVRELLETKGEGRVLVVDGGGSMRCALVGGNLGQLAQNMGWAYLVPENMSQTYTISKVVDEVSQLINSVGNYGRSCHYLNLESLLGAEWGVFVSCADTRCTFVGHLLDSLDRTGVRVFRDDPELHSVEEVSVTVTEVIKNSKIYVVVFSEKYAYSRRCLNELVEMFQKCNSTGRTILPVFYNIVPSIVRYQVGSFNEAFQEHKTTLAKALFKQLWPGSFKRCCFLENVKEVSGTDNGLVQLQQQLIKDMLPTHKRINIDNVDQGIEVIRSRFCSMKVLIVIDNVNDPETLEFLVGTFALGSIIIITTENEDLLDSVKVEAKYKVNEPGDAESRQLCWNF